MNRYNVGDRVRFIGQEDKDLPKLQQGHIGTIWSVGVGKSWVWVVFDTLERPIAVHHNEIEILSKDDDL